MTIEEMLGDLHTIDIMAETENNELVLFVVCNGYIDGSAETQTALLDKMENYLVYIQSDEVQSQYSGWTIVLKVTFTEKPDQLIMDLLDKCSDWVDDYGAVLEIEIG